MDHFDIAPSPWDSVRLLTAADGSRAVAAVADGAGFWGRGSEAAKFVADELQTYWRRRVPSADEVVSDLQEALKRLPPGIRNDEDGHDFCFAAVVVEGAVVTALARGWYGVAAFRNDRVDIVHQPRMWVEEQVAAGFLSEEEAENHPLRHVYAGPTVNASDSTLTRYALAPASPLCVAEGTVLRRLVRRSLVPATTAAAVQRLDSERTHAVILWPQGA